MKTNRRKEWSGCAVLGLDKGGAVVIEPRARFQAVKSDLALIRKVAANLSRRAGKATLMRGLSTKQLVAELRNRVGKRPAYHTLPGLSPLEMWQLYETLCQTCRAVGIRF